MKKEMLEVKVSEKKAYGRKMYAPENNVAQLFCDLVAQGNLTLEQLQIIKKLGFSVVPVSDLDGI